MKRTFAFLTMLALAPVATASARTTDNAMLLLQRLAAQNGGGRAEVFVGKLPADMPKVPLPDASIVGSVHRRIESQNGPATDTYDLYYQATPGSANAYQTALAAAGWTDRQMPMFNGGGGFVSSSGPSFAMFCKTSAPLVTIRQGEDPQDLHVAITARNESADLVCGGPEGMARMMASAMRSVLPELHAPSGVTISAGSSVPQNSSRSAAYIHSGSSAGALLDAFAAQMTAAGWQAGVKSSGTAVVTQAFQKTDDKKVQWNAIVSVNAIDGKPGEFVAFIDATCLNGPSAGYNSVIIRSP